MRTRRVLGQRCLVLFLAIVMAGGMGSVAFAGKIAPNLGLALSHAPIQGSFRPASGGGERIRVVVQSSCSNAVLEQEGFQVSGRIGDVITGRVSRDGIRHLATLSCVQYIEAPVPVHIQMDKSYPAIQGNLARTGSVGAYTGLTGRDVLIGIIDTGIDIHHPDFQGQDGTRILRLWDQTIDGTPPASFSYGSECTKAQIDAGTCTEQDQIGHGTHVAGIAAGNGQATGNGFPSGRYVSAAPEADLIVVKVSNTGSFESDRLIDAISYLTARATELNRPLVVNLSLGSQFGPHDGTSLLSRAVDNASGPGRIFVISAGNEGNNDPALHSQPDVHATGTVPDTVSIQLPSCRNEGALNDVLALDIWYSGHMCVDIQVTSPNGITRHAATGESNDESERWTEDGYIYISNAVDGVNPNNFDHEAVVQIFDFFDKNSAGERVPAPGIWTIQISKQCEAEDETYHLWVYDNQFCRSGFGITSSNKSNRYLIASPADAVRGIAVGAFTARNRWTNVDGNVEEEPDAVGAIAFFSSPGPTRDGRRKPDITAPGNLVISPLSAQAKFEYPTENIADDGVHALVKGTSFSAPHVTSAVALFLQIDSQLDPSQVKNLLTAAATSDAFTGLTPNNLWGFGKVNILASLRLLPPAGPEITKTNRVSDTTGELFWDEPPIPATQIAVERRTGENGTWERIVVLPGTERSYRDESLSKGETYTYRIVALFNQLESHPGSEQTLEAEPTRNDGGGGGCFIQTVAW